jgi:long-chain acyl-CoA synthetase
MAAVTPMPAEVQVGRRIAAIMAVDPAAGAVAYGARWTTWGQLSEAGAAINELLSAQGLGGPGLRIGLVMRNRPGHVAAILNTVVSAQCLEPINSIQSDQALAADIAALQVPVIIADEEDWARLGPIARSAFANAVCIGLPRVAAGPPYLVASDSAPAPTVGRTRPGVAIWMPTSGTTGPPKRIPIGYDDLGQGFGRVAEYSGGAAKAFGAETLQKGTALIVTPLVHIAGLWAVLQFAMEGRRAALMDRFEPVGWADLVEAYRPIIASLPPAAIRMVLDAGIPAGKLSSLRALGSGTAPLPPEVAEAFTERFGVPVLTSYGATEFPGGLVGWSLADYKAFSGKRGSVGRARPGVQIRVVDPESGEPVPPRQDGLIEAMTGQKLGRASVGWVRTNDLGRLDEDGFLWVIGRADDAVNRGGFKIVPTIIENALCSYPGVRGAIAVGLPDRRLGEVPVAAVEADPAVTEADLVAWCREHLTSYQVPTRVLVRPELPRTPSLKVSRVAVRELFAAARGDADAATETGHLGGSPDRALRSVAAIVCACVPESEPISGSPRSLRTPNAGPRERCRRLRGASQ